MHGLSQGIRNHFSRYVDTHRLLWNTMLTMGADDHQVMRHMHKPDPKFAAD